MPVILRRAGASVGWLTVLVGLALAGCASAPPQVGGAPATRSPGSSDPGRDGPEASPPSGLDRVPDAAPKVESIRSGGPNKPYEVFGREYVPFTQDRAFRERGLASWYGRKFQGRPTASGEIYDMYAMTAAHPTLPIPSYARVRNPANGREIVVRVNDRGPFHPGRIIDLSYTAALKLDLLRGVAPVEIERITYEDIRAGTWRRDRSGEAVQLAAREPSVTAPLVAVAANDAESREPLAPRLASAPSSAADVMPGTAASERVRAPSSPSVDTGGPATPAASNIAAVAAVTSVAEGAPRAATLAPIANGPNAQAFTKPARGFWVQLGAFRERDGAAALQRRVGDELAGLSPLLAVFSEAALFRLQAGPYASRDDARGAAESIRSALQLVTLIVERR
ncbi:MAG: septal ring lytic transglycosylase RlpA family protein [Caldimonas sp.]